LELLTATFSANGGDGREAVWTMLQAEWNKHREFADADWSIKGKPLELLASAVAQLEPQDFISKHRWLFDNQWPTMPRSKGVRRPDAAAEAREDVISDLYAKQREDGVIALAKAVKLPYLVAQAFVEISPGVPETIGMLDCSLAESALLDRFSAVVVAQGEQRFGVAWRKALLDYLSRRDMSANALGSLLHFMEDSEENWAFVDGFGEAVAAYFWKHKPSLYLRSEDPRVLTVATRRYLQQGRALGAINAISSQNSLLSTEVIFDLLDSAVAELNADEANATNFSTYEIEQLFDVLAARPEVPLVDIARREYRYLPLFSYREKSLTLHKLMAEDGDFYVSILNDVYKPAHGDVQEPSPEVRGRAEFGYRLLKSFEQVPGQQGKDIDIKRLRGWITVVRQRAAENDRVDVADEYIGRTLAHGSDDPTDAAWPHRAIRDLIEEFAVDHIDTGIITERYNMRGVHSKSPDEGGDQERVLAAQYQGWADAAHAWPRTNVMLEKIARQWRREGEDEDRRARERALQSD